MTSKIEYDYLIVGAGLSGAVLAERLASVNNAKVLVIDKRNHLGGNCYDYVDEASGILMNKYGAHIFHTNYQHVWDYVCRFSEWVRYDHKVLSNVDGTLVSVPVNINTVNALCNVNIKDTSEMDTWLSTSQCKYDNITNSEEMAKSRVGETLYEKMFRPYTLKQWAKEPRELDPSVLARIPIRNNFDDRYFTDRYQALPSKGYTNFIKNILIHPNITILLDTDFFEFINSQDYLQSRDSSHIWREVIMTGPIDSFCSKIITNKCNNSENADKEDSNIQLQLEPLEYRSINFAIERLLDEQIGYYQPVSVVNYPSIDTNYTRIVEYKHFPNQLKPSSNILGTVIVKETTTDTGEPYYPVPNKRNLELFDKYQKMTKNISGVHFIGRLANYKYFNMDEAIKNALEYFDIMIVNKK
jgi:UDP-galactopyranose mutase